MDIRTTKITAANADESIKSLYTSAFPKEEQIPWNDLLQLIDRMPLDFTAYYQGEKFIGFTIVYPHKPYNWFWYFAVRDELRGNGYGQQILSLLIDRYKTEANILDMESPEQRPCDNLEHRQRRRDFYLRNGFRETHVYRNFDGLEFTIMMMGEGTFTRQDYDDIINDLHRHWNPDK